MNAEYGDFDRALRAHLSAEGIACVVRERVDSTNLCARRLLERTIGSEPTAIVAWQQSAGRGRRDRSWISRAGRGVYASVLAPEMDRRDLESLSLTTAVVLARALTIHLPRPVGIKWPNDLMVGDAKLGGVLVDAVSRGDQSAAIIGFGVNHGRRPPPLDHGRAASVGQGSTPPPLARLAAELVIAVVSLVVRPPDRVELLAELRRRSVHRRGDPVLVRTSSGEERGRFYGIDDHGRLLLDTHSGLQTFVVGDLVTLFARGPG